MRFPARFERAESGRYVVTFRDIPEAMTQGEDMEDAMAMARDVLLSAMDFYVEDKREVPAPSAAQKGELMVDLPPSAAVKVLLLNEMVRQKVGGSELARRMGTSPQVVNRIIDLSHATKIDQVAEAIAALGRRLELSTAPLA